MRMRDCDPRVLSPWRRLLLRHGEGMRGASWGRGKDTQCARSNGQRLQRPQWGRRKRRQPRRCGANGRLHRLRQPRTGRGKRPPGAALQAAPPPCTHRPRGARSRRACFPLALSRVTGAMCQRLRGAPGSGPGSRGGSFTAPTWTRSPAAWAPARHAHTPRRSPHGCSGMSALVVSGLRRAAGCLAVSCPPPQRPRAGRFSLKREP